MREMPKFRLSNQLPGTPTRRASASMEWQTLKAVFVRRGDGLIKETAVSPVALAQGAEGWLLLLWCIFSMRNRQLSEIRAPRQTLGIGGPSLCSQLACGLWPVVVRFVAPARRPSPETTDAGHSPAFARAPCFFVRYGASLYRPTASRDIRPRSAGGGRSLVVW